MKTIPELFTDSASRFGNNIYLYEKTGDAYIGITYAQTREAVELLAAGLMWAGLQKGDRVAILSEGRNAWIIGELAVLFAGGCSVPLSVKLDAGTELRFRLQHSGCVMAMISQQQAHKIESIRNELPDLKHLIYFDEKAGIEETDFTLSKLQEAGRQFVSQNPDAVLTRQTSVSPHDLANISYTSGTTADPKGIMLTHLNYTANVKQALTLMDIPPTHRTLAILPWDHSFAHTACLYCFMAKGASVGSVQTGRTPIETIKNVPVNIRELKPNLLMSVPALSKNFRKSVESSVQQKGRLASLLFAFALKVAYACNGSGYNRGRGLRALLLPLNTLFDALLFRKIREGFGGNLEYFIGGGALLDIELQRFFFAIGIPVCQGYGLSETAPVISSNSLSNIKMGTSGRLVDYLELKICDSNGHELPKGEAGEIVVKGDNVMKGYWNNPAATAGVLRDGWLYTGDLGYLDKDNFLVVLGRSKSLLIGNDGEKFSPEGIEEALATQTEYIAQAMLYNNQNAYTVGLIVPDMAAIRRQLKHTGTSLQSEEAIDEALGLLQHDVNAFFRHGKFHGTFPERWLPAAIGVLPEAFSEQNGFINSTLKMVRGKITSHYQPMIQTLYTPAGKQLLSSQNRHNMSRWLRG